MCRNCTDIRKAYIGYVAIYALFYINQNTCYNSNKWYDNMKYKKQFEKIISSMDENFNWTTNIDTKLFCSLINNEISNNHELHNKKIIPIALCTNKYIRRILY